MPDMPGEGACHGEVVHRLWQLVAEQASSMVLKSVARKRSVVQQRS